MEKTTKDKVLSILIAIGFGLIGAVLWGVLYYYEIIIGLASMFIVYLIYYAYKKFGKLEKLTKSDYTIIIIISFIEMVLAIVVSLGVTLMLTYAENGVTIGIFEAIAETFRLISSNREVMVAFIFDMFASLLFYVVGVVACFVSERNIHDKKEEYSKYNFDDKKREQDKQAENNALETTKKETNPEVTTENKPEEK